VLHEFNQYGSQVASVVQEYLYDTNPTGQDSVGMGIPAWFSRRNERVY
jgi:hypothetical protein